MNSRGFLAFLYSYFSLFLEKCFNFLSAFFVISFLSVDEFGLYSILQNLLVLFIGFAFGIPKVIDRYLPEFEQNRDWDLMWVLVKYSFSIRFFLSLVIVFLLYNNVDSFVHFFNIPKGQEKILQLFSILVFFHINSHTVEIVLLARLEHKFVQIVKRTFQILQILVLYYLLLNDYSVYGIIAILTLTNALQFLIFSKKVFTFIQNLPDFDTLSKKFPKRRIIKYGSIYFSSTLAFIFIAYTADIFFLGYYSDNSDVGIYSFAVKLSTMVFSFSPAIVFQGIFTNLLIRKNSNGINKANLTKSIFTYYKLICFFNIPLIIISFLYVENIILIIFPEDYVASVNLFRYILIISILSMIQIPLHPLIKVIERPDIILATSVFAILKIILSFYLIPIYNLDGAIASSGICLFLVTSSLVIMIKKEINLHFPWSTFFRFIVNSLLLFSTLIMFKNFATNFWVLLLIVFLSLSLYLFACYINKGFDTKERKLINGAIGRDWFIF